MPDIWAPSECDTTWNKSMFTWPFRNHLRIMAANGLLNYCFHQVLVWSDHVWIVNRCIQRNLPTQHLRLLTASSSHLLIPTNPERWCCGLCAEDMRQLLRADFHLTGLLNIRAYRTLLADSYRIGGDETWIRYYWRCTPHFHRMYYWEILLAKAAYMFDHIFDKDDKCLPNKEHKFRSIDDIVCGWEADVAQQSSD